VRALTDNERRLLFIVGLVALLALSAISFNFWSAHSRKLSDQIRDLRTQHTVATTWLAEKDAWLQRKAWLDAAQPLFPATEGEANSAVLKTIQETARSHEIVIAEQSFAASVPTPGYRQVAVKLKVIGSMEGISRWMVDLQQPTNFQAVVTFALKVDKQDPKTKVQCDLTVARWFQTAGS
jgi:hypothetical protein